MICVLCDWVCTQISMSVDGCEFRRGFFGEFSNEPSPLARPSQFCFYSMHDKDSSIIKINWKMK